MERFDTSRRWPGESGQAAVIVLIILAAFLLGVLGFATDYAQVWAHRQSAQAAADAACQAGAADLYLDYASSGSGLSFGWVGTASDCSSASNSVCEYATYNGYSGSNVSYTFPSSVPGVSLSGFGTIAYPFIKVSVTDNVPLTFSRFLQSASTFQVHAAATCGMNPVAVPIPMVVLNKTASGSFSFSGSSTVSIIGGPNRSVQVDSSSTTAFSAGGNGLVDLSLAGPNGTGADIGVFGNETQPASKNVNLGTGKWDSPALPYGDPWATIGAPSEPATAGSAIEVGYGVNGCPDQAGCIEFSAGDYSGCNNGNLNSGDEGCLSIPVKSMSVYTWHQNRGFVVNQEVQPTSNNAGNFVYVVTISGTSGGAQPGAWPQTTGATVLDGTVTWKNVGAPTSNPDNTAIFDPGLYYLDGNGLQLASNSTVRPSTATGDGSYGTTFYFSQACSGKNCNILSVDANSGKVSSSINVYTVAGDAYSQPLECPSGASNPTQIPATLSGNVLLGPCTGTYADVTSSGTEYRGFLFFQGHSFVGSANWGGGGQFLLTGFMYFHDTTYLSTLSMSGGSSSGSYTLGNMVTDELSLQGNSGIDMVLDPAASYEVLRPTLLQ